MEKQKHGDIETWRHEDMDMDTWRHGDIETWRLEMETWKHGDIGGDMET